jgi:phosphohistidine phosphatase
MEMWDGYVGPAPKKKAPDLLKDSVKRLIFMRHATSPFGSGSDKERFLAIEGKMEARKIAQQLEAKSIPIQHFFVSSAKRAQQTFTEVNAVYKRNVSLDLDLRDDLYDASMGDILGAVQTLSEVTRYACFIGHNPGISQIVNFLFDGKNTSYDDMELSIFPPASCAVLEWDGKEKGEMKWSDIQPSSMKMSLFLTP